MARTVRQSRTVRIPEHAGAGDRPTRRRLLAFWGWIPFTGMLVASSALAQDPNDLFPDPIVATEDVIVVDFVEFARVPDFNDRAPPRLIHLDDEPGTGRIFAVTMRGPLYTISYDGRTVVEYLDVDDPRWGIGVTFDANQKGVLSVAVHPQFNEAGAPGFGKLYVWTDTHDTGPPADFKPWGGEDDHDTVLLEWTASDPAAQTYDGGPPRELLRLEQPFLGHNGGQIAFDPLASPGDDDFGLLYVAVGDGGRADPLKLAQNLASPFGKLLRIDPLGSNSGNGEYGIPADNPFAGDGVDGTLGEIFAFGMRHPQRLAWDPRNGTMFLTDVGHRRVEELSIVTPGANLGWSVWEGSYRFPRPDLTEPRSDPSVTYPVAEYGRYDSLFVGRTPRHQVAATGLVVYRGDAIPELSDLVLFGDNPTGEIFYVPADDLPEGGQTGLRRILLNDGGVAKTFLQIIREKNAAQGRKPAVRADLRIAAGPDGQVFLLNKQDGIVRLLVP